MMSRDQYRLLGYDKPGLLSDLQVMYPALPWLDLQVGLSGGIFKTKAPRPGGVPPRKPETGATVAPLLGLTFRYPHTQLSPFVFADAGPAFTGEYVRPELRVGTGLDIRLSRGVYLGPILGYTQIRQKTGKYYTDSARFLWAGITLSVRPEPPVKNEPKTQLVERWNERPRAPAPPPEPPPYEPVNVPQVDDNELRILLEHAVPVQVVRTELVAPVLFKFDSDTLEPVGTAMLHEVARTLTERTDLKLVAIEGYCDRRGSDEYNLDLAMRRAQRVFDWLVDHGVAPERLRVTPAGATAFVEHEDHEDAHQQNRRVIFRVLETEQP